jgi:hypothetical protein
MDEKIFERKMTRRDFIRKGARTGIGIGLGMSALGTILTGRKRAGP